MRDEADLIRAAARGDVEAFESLVLRKREKVVRTAYQIVGDLEDARDVAQGVFVTLWRSLGSYDPGRPFDTWLHRVTVNAAIDHLRRNGPRGAIQALPDDEDRLPAADVPSPDRAVDRERLQRAFFRLAARLAPQQRAVFVLREIEGRSSAEIAATLGIAESTVRNHLLQARRILGEGLRREYPGLVPDEDPS